MSKYQHCKLRVECEPKIIGIRAELLQATHENIDVFNYSQIEGLLSYPFRHNEQLALSLNQEIFYKLDLNSISFDKQSSDIPPTQISFKDKKYTISVYMELQELTQIDLDNTFYTFDLSVSGLQLKAKCFSCFPSIPLTFYEILKLNETAPQQQLYESEITKAPGQDPFWMPSGKLSKADLDPLFRVNVYNSIDQNKSKKQFVGGVDIDFQALINNKEFMFELDGMEKAYVIIDRIQEVKSGK